MHVVFFSWKSLRLDIDAYYFPFPEAAEPHQAPFVESEADSTSAPPNLILGMNLNLFLRLKSVFFYLEMHRNRTREPLTDFWVFLQFPAGNSALAGRFLASSCHLETI